MIKTRFLLFMAVAFVCNMLATAQVTGYGYMNGINCRRIAAWCPDYPTVINTWDGLMIEGECPPVMAVIRSIDGVDAAEITDDNCNAILCDGNAHRLVYEHKVGGRNVVKEITFKSATLWVDFEENNPIQKPDNINMFSDYDVDFFKYNTFDFVLEGKDKLSDKSIVNKLEEVLVAKGLKRNAENPDLIIKMQKSLEQQTNSVYVPETKQVVATGATAQTRYNLFTGKPYVATTVHNKVVTSGGYTHTGVNATFKLQLSVYDGNSLRAGTAEEDAMVWQLDYNKFASEAIDIMDVVSNEVWFYFYNYPFNNNVYSYNFQTLGVAFRNEDEAVGGYFYKVFDGSPLAEAGFCSGDQLKKAYTSGIFALFGWASRHTLFKQNTEVGKKHWHIDCILIPYPGYTKQRADYLTKTSVYWTGKTNYLVYDGQDERKITIRDDFSEKVIDHRYISNNAKTLYLQ